MIYHDVQRIIDAAISRFFPYKILDHMKKEYTIGYAGWYIEYNKYNRFFDIQRNVIQVAFQ